MGVGWGAAALVCGMAAMVMLGLVLVVADGRAGRPWVRLVAVAAGAAVVAGCAWLTVSPVRTDTAQGSRVTVVCGTDNQAASLDEDCRTAVLTRRLLVFVPLGLITVGGAVGVFGPLVRPSGNRTSTRGVAAGEET